MTPLKVTHQISIILLILASTHEATIKNFTTGTEFQLQRCPLQYRVNKSPEHLKNHAVSNSPIKPGCSLCWDSTSASVCRRENMTICLSPSSEPCILCSDQLEGNCWLCSGTDDCYASAGWQCTPCETGSKSEEGTQDPWLKKGVAAFLFLASFLVSVVTLIVVLWKRHGKMSQLRASRLLDDVLHTEAALLEANGDCPHPHQTHRNQSNVLSSGRCNCDQARLTVTLCSKGWQIRTDIGNENKIGPDGRRGEGVLSQCQCVHGCRVRVHERQTEEDGRPSVGSPVGEMATTETENHFSHRHNLTAGEIVMPLLLPTSKSNKGTFNVSLIATTDNVIIKENGVSRSSHGFKEVQSETIDGPVLERIFFTSGL